MNWHTIWNVICYTCLALSIAGQILVGEWYLIGQGLYLIANILTVIRDVQISLPTANIVKDVSFLAITIGLIGVRLFGLIF